MKTIEETGTWGMEALWRVNTPKCIVSIVDTIFLHDRKPAHWLFTAKTGEVLRKKGLDAAAIVDRFSRISLANDRNEEGFVCIGRKKNGRSVVWNMTQLSQQLDGSFNDILAIQPYICSRGSRGSIYQHEIRAEKAKPIQSTYKIMQQYMTSSETDVDPCLPEQRVKSNASTINSRLHGISMLVCRHFEEIHAIRIKEVTLDFIIDDDEQIWLSWIPRVVFQSKQPPIALTNHSSMPLLGSCSPQEDQWLFNRAQDSIQDPKDYQTSLESIGSNNEVDDTTLQRRSLNHFTIKPKPQANHMAFKCCGDFCSFDLLPPTQLSSDGSNTLAPRQNTTIQSFFSPAEMQILGNTNLSTLERQSQQHYSQDKLYSTITYRSIALAKQNKEQLHQTIQQEEEKKKKERSYMDATISKQIKQTIDKVYGELDGGTANYYRQVKVCRNCFVVYTMLDAARKMLEQAHSRIKAEPSRHARASTKQSRDLDERLPVIASPGRESSPRPISPSIEDRPSEGREIITMPQIDSKVSLKKSATTSTLHSKQRSWIKDKANPVEATKTAEDFVGLDRYLRGKTRRRKTKELHENKLFPQGMELPSKPKTPSPYMPLILIIEADQSVINSILSQLQTEYSIESVCDGAVGLKCAQETHYDAIVCNRDAPSLGAIEFTRVLRQHEIQHSIAMQIPVVRSPVICLTTHTSAEDLRVYMEVGMDGCLGLPLDNEALFQTIRGAVTPVVKAPPPTLQSILSKAKSSVPPSNPPKQKRPKKDRDITSANPFPQPTQTDTTRYAGMYQMDVDTSFPFVILNRPTSNAVNTFFNLVIVHDIFDTLERLQIFFQPLIARYRGAQILLWNYPGQAFTTWRKGALLNNAFLATCLKEILHHVGPNGIDELRDQPFYLVGYGNGVSIALEYCLRSPGPLLRALVSINGFAYVDSTLAGFLHDAMKVFSCSPASRPDLPVYFHARFLFSGAYLATVSTPLALNLYTAVSNSITLEGRIALCLGALSHLDLRRELELINVPTILLCSAQDGLVQPLHVDAIVGARGGQVESIHRVLAHRKKTCIVWLQAGHEVFQECKPVMSMMMEQFLTGFHETNEVPLTQTPPAPLPQAKSPVRLSYEDHFINKVMATLSDVKTDTGDASTGAAWTTYQAKIGKESKPKRKPVFDPTNPSFERDTNHVYQPGDGSKIYPDPTTRADVKEYMQWRVQRNATRLERMNKLASRIQKSYRAYRARTLADRLRRQKAALTIERVYRGYKGRLLFAKRKKEDWAVRLVQRTWRGKMGRMEFKSTKSRRLATIEIQRLVRGFLSRQRVKHLRQLRYRSACLIQALFKRVHAIKIAWKKRQQNQGTLNIQRIYRGHLGRKRFRAERERYLFSRAQSQNIDFGKQMLLEYKLYGTRLQSEVQLLADEKTKTEAHVETLLNEIAEFEAGVRVLETEMHSLSQIETEATGVLDEQAKWQLREQKMRLDQEFGMMLKKIADRREKLVVLGNTLQTLDRTRHTKEEDLRGLERKLVLLLDEQQRQLNGIKAKQEKRSQILVDVAGGVREPGPLGASLEGSGQAVAAHTTVSPEQRQEANSLMESTETMMKFGFMSMSMTYFSSMNMIKAMRHIGAHHTFLESAAAIHDHAKGGAFQAEPGPGKLPGQEPLLASAWSVKDVGRWLDTLSLGQYKQAFSDGTVDGSLLYDLNDHDLRFSLGIEYELHRKKILQTVERLKIAEGVTKDRLFGHGAPSQSMNMESTPVAQSPASVGSLATPSQPTNIPAAITSSGNAPPPMETPPLVVKFDELCSLVRNGKLKQVKEAFEKWPDKPFDPISVKTQNATGVGTIYEDGLEHQAFHMNKSDDHGNTLLLLATQNNLIKVVQYLVSKGANPNHQNHQGQTAGHYAMAYSFFDLGAWLLDPDKGGGRDDLLNMHGLTAYDGLSP